MKILNRVLASPFFISLIPFLFIFFFVPLNFEKYSFEIVSKTKLFDNQYIYYEDLDYDGISEEIVASIQDYTTAVMISKNGDVIDQWNLNGSFDFWHRDCLFITGDSNNDKVKELYIFTLQNDTILLHCIENPGNPKLTIKNRVISSVGPGNKKPDPFIIRAEMDDLDDDGRKDLVFGIGSGFSIYPRKVYAYFIDRDSLIQSPESSYFIGTILQADINNDGKREIIPHGIASSNVDPQNAEYHDHSAYLMVLDQNLNFPLQAC